LWHGPGGFWLFGRSLQQLKEGADLPVMGRHVTCGKYVTTGFQAALDDGGQPAPSGDQESGRASVGVAII